ncbi:MAG: hypothetical protein COB53_08745 [Elusimicrobia bacterium]|nr:MAG: hypothetical protein COB53_08745 [Elusimicrobiota bacterium]
MRLFIFLVLIVSATNAQSATTDEINKIPHFEVAASTMDVAVVIGIEKYRDVGPAAYAASDAVLFSKYLLKMGYAQRNIRLLINERATNSDLEMAIETWLPNQAVPGGKVVVYYSGHGAPDPATGEAYLVPHNGDPAYLAKTAYPIKRLHEKLADLTNSKVALLMDACFSGSGGRSVIAPGARPLVTLISPVLQRGDNVTIMTASEDSQISTSSPERGHGLFTYHLIKALRAGKGSVSDIYDYLRTKVQDDARRLNVSQTPTLSKAAESFMIADIKGVVFEKPKKPKVSPEALKELAATKRLLAEQKKEMDAERKRLAAESKNKDKALKAERKRMEKELADKATRDKKRLQREKREQEAELKRKKRAQEAEIRRKKRELRKLKKKKKSYRSPPPP